MPWRRERLSTPLFFPGEFHGQRNLAGYSPWGLKESDNDQVTNYTTTTTQLKQQKFIFHVNESWKPVSGEASLPGLQAVHNNGFWKS